MYETAISFQNLNYVFIFHFEKMNTPHFTKVFWVNTELINCFVPPNRLLFFLNTDAFANICDYTRNEPKANSERPDCVKGNSKK